MQNSQHCINCLLRDTRNNACFTRRNHSYVLSLQLVSVFLCQPVTVQY